MLQTYSQSKVLQSCEPLTSNVLRLMLVTLSSSPFKGLHPPHQQSPLSLGGLPAGGEWGPRQLRPHEEGRKMPAELLLLLIVAFASPSCQVLSSLRMGEVLQQLLSQRPPAGS